MSAESGRAKLHIDSDWKEEAAREKERLAEQELQEEKQGRPVGAPGDVPASFFELVNLLALQAAVGLGGFSGPSGERIPPNPVAAKHHIDLLDVVKEKTRGNLSDEEQRALDSVLYELRMQYVHSVTKPPGAGKTQEEGK